MKSIVLGAGKGKRLLSEQNNIPKVLRKANGKTLLSYVLEKLDFLEPKDIVLVVGYMKEKVIKEIGNDYIYVTQEEQLGTGHAVAMAKDILKDFEGDVLVLYGDMPIIKKATYENIFAEHKKKGNTCTVLTCVTEHHLPYGRIVKNSDGMIINIVEQKDCNEEQKAIKELNVGVYVFDCKSLFSVLSLLKNNNSQGEYYLTDAPKLLASMGKKVGAFPIYDQTEIVGVNTLEDLKFVEKAIKEGY